MSGNCSVCGASDSPFGLRNPPDKGEYQWFCRAHHPDLAGPRAQFNFDLGQAGLDRDEAFRKVLANNRDWTVRMTAFIRYKLPPGWDGMSEQIWPLARRMAPEIGEPSHHNTMGAIINEAAAKGLLRDTGRVGHMRSEKSNGRRTPIWVRTDLV